MSRIQYPYVWLFCGFAALGACLYGYDGVYFNGVSTLGTSAARSDVYSVRGADKGLQTPVVPPPSTTMPAAN